MIVYATHTDLTSWIGAPQAESEVKGHLRAASVLVRDACVNDLYDITPAGLPSDPDLAEALVEATCAQAEIWLALGVDPVAGAAALEAEVTKSSIDGASIEVDASVSAAATAAKVASLDCLAPIALSILRAVGLASAAVRGC